MAKRKKRNRRSIDGAVCGLARLYVAREDLIKLLNLLLELGESYGAIDTGETSASVELIYSSARRAERCCRKRGIEAEVELFFGLPYLLVRLLARPGLIVGMLSALLLLWAGSGILWDIRIEGNERLSDAELLAALSEQGVRPGVPLDSLDIGEIQTELERKNDDVAWISVNLIGTVAYVEVVEENVPPEEPSREGDGCNLIAGRDGVIAGLEIIAGEPVVAVGQTVRKGELLAGGLLESERLGYRAVEARGRVLAVTERTFEAEIPYVYTVRTAQKREICEISMIFFSFRKIFFKKGGFSGAEYDTIYSDKYIYSRNGATIPVGISLSLRPIFTETEQRRTASEAAELAYFELDRMLLAELPEAEILDKSFEGGVTEDGAAYRLVCRLRCIEDIAVRAPFYIKRSAE